MTPSDDSASDVEESEVVCGFLRPSDQDGAEAIEPGMGAFDDPPSRLGAGLPLGSDLLAAGAQMQGEAERGGEVTRLLVVVALVEAEMLLAAWGWRGPLDRYGLDGRLHHLVVVAVCAIARHRQRHAAAVGELRALDAALGAIRRIGAGLFPTQRSL